MVADVLKTMWTDTCTVTQRAKVVDATTKLTTWSESDLFSNEPCKLSFESYGSATGAPVATVGQGVKLFLDSSKTVPAGSKVTVTRGNNTFVYKSSGEPAVFHNHQEINLELFQKWA